jgi:hypothetical protein
MIRSAVSLALFALLAYGTVKAWPLLRGPFIELAIPTDYTSSPDGFVTLKGVAHNTEALFLNNGPLLIDPEGRFEKTLLLPSGGAILTLTATDRFGRVSTKQRTVYIP